jgi:short-subunit dehydrogenase
MNKKTCVVAGVGPGIGKACCEHYAQQGYRVVMLARQQDYLTELASSLPANTISIAVDLSDETAVNQAFAKIEEQCGAIDTLIYNAARGSFGSFLDAKPEDLEKNFAINTMGLLYCARACAPKMIVRGSGSIIVTGNTAATRGGAKFATFAPSKAAARSLSQSMARELGPKHVHVAYLVIDGAIDGPFARGLSKDKPDNFFIQPSAITDAIWFLDQQPENSWTFEMDLRPFKESW